MREKMQVRPASRLELLRPSKQKPKILADFRGTPRLVGTVFQSDSRWRRNAANRNDNED